MDAEHAGHHYRLGPAENRGHSSLEIAVQNQRLAFSVVSQPDSATDSRWGWGAKITLFAALTSFGMPALAASTPLVGWMMWPALVFTWPVRLVLPWVETVWRTWTRADVIAADPGGSRVTSGPAVMWTQSALAGRVGKPIRLMAFSLRDVEWDRLWSRLDDIRDMLGGIVGSPKIQPLLADLSEFYTNPLFPQRAGKRLVVRALNRLVADRTLWQRLPIESDRLNMEARDIMDRLREEGPGRVPWRSMYALNRQLLLALFGPALSPGGIRIVLFDGLLHAEHFRQLHRIYPFAEAFVSSEGSPNQHSILGLLSRWPRLMAVTGARDLHELWAPRRGEVRSAIVDESGAVLVNPSPVQERWARRLSLERDTMSAAARLTDFDRHAAASSPVDIYLNATSPEAIREGLAGGAMGVGLVRFEDVWGVRTPLTDYALVLSQAEMVPGMARPLESLVKTAQDFDVPIHIRMLDAQDDKLEGLMDGIEQRGLDFLLHHPIGQRLAMAQIIALADLVTRHPKTRLSVLFPDVKTVSDVKEIFELIRRCLVVRPDLAREIIGIPVRLMVESPVPDAEFVEMISMDGVSGVSLGTNSWLENYYGVKRGTPESRDHETQLDLPLLWDIQRFVGLVSRVNADRPLESALSVHVCGNFAARDDALGLWPGLARRFPHVPLRLSVPPKQAARIGFVLRHEPEDFSMDLLDDLLKKAESYVSIVNRLPGNGANADSKGGKRFDLFRLNALHFYAQRRVEGFLHWTTLLIQTSPDYQRLKDRMERDRQSPQSQNGPGGGGFLAFAPVGVDLGEGGWSWQALAPLFDVPDATVWGMGLFMALTLIAIRAFGRRGGAARAWDAIRGWSESWGWTARLGLPIAVADPSGAGPSTPALHGQPSPLDSLLPEDPAGPEGATLGGNVERFFHIQSAFGRSA